MQRGSKPGDQVKIARERILILLDEAKKAPSELAQRYCRLAKRIGMRYNVRLGKLRRRFCKYCYTYFTAANSSRRLRNGVLNVKCFSCGKIMRFPYR